MLVIVKLSINRRTIMSTACAIVYEGLEGVGDGIEIMGV